MPPTSPLLLLALIGAPVALPCAGPEPPRDELWTKARDVLEARCLTCHGGERVKNGLRFSNAETFRRGGDRGAVFDADHPEKSRLLEVIEYRNPELAMPPDGRLPDGEVEALRQWILGGAPWPEDPLSGQLSNPELFPEESHQASSDDRDWWAYRPLVAPTIPAVAEERWSRHAIDAFLEARRRSEGLAPAGPATPTTLLRRATYNLLGLPPTPSQQERFQARIEAVGLDRAWGELVDELLASPHHGEHWARHWLDLVRYADTNGYERDGTKRNSWRYRDWVVRSLNADKPYDRFATEQLAGDELALLEHGGGDGLSDEQAEAMLATGYLRLGVWDDEPSDRKQALADELADIIDTTGQVFLATTVGCARCHDHKADPIRQADYFALTALFNNLKSYGGGAFGQHLGGGMTRDLSDAEGPFVLTPEERDERVRVIDAALLELARSFDVELPRDEVVEEHVLVADGRSEGGAATWRYLLGEAPEGWHTQGFDDSGWSEGLGGFGVEETSGAIVGTVWDGHRIQIRTRFRLAEIPEHLVLSFHHDDDVSIYLNGQEIQNRKGSRPDYDEVELDEGARSNLVVGSNSLAVVCVQHGGAQFVDVGLRTGHLKIEAEDWMGELRDKARSHPERPEAHEVRRLNARRERLYKSPSTHAYAALVASEYGEEAPEQRVHLRGSAHAQGDPVEPDVPLVFRSGEGSSGFAERAPSLPNSTGRRLAFARWLFDEGSFLTARVMANRLWQFHFGRGICATPGDFGRLGVEPTHPELLDHLATKLIENGWSLKAMHRYLMSSHSYRMSSVGNEAARNEDPRNLLYWRFEPRRLTAEEYRDSVLAVNGTLNPDLFGPSVFPALAPEVLATASRPHSAWGYSPPEQEVRRSLYIFVKRSLRHPVLASLDQPDPDLPCPARFPTNVPTQALITMNGTFTHENAESFARDLMVEHEGDKDLLLAAVRQALGREPDDDELQRSLAFLTSTRSEYDLDDEQALTLFCLGLYNRNEFLWLD